VLSEKGSNEPLTLRKRIAAMFSRGRAGLARSGLSKSGLSKPGLSKQGKEA
jgi:hypothetical protein